MRQTRTRASLFLIFLTLLAPPMALVQVGVGIPAIRVLALSKWLLAAALLLWLTRPSPRELRCAAWTGGTMALADFLGEGLGVASGLWSYQGALLLWGIPIDIPLDFFLAGVVFCLGYALLGPARRGRPARALYIVGWGALMGWIAYLTNIWAPRAGFVSIAEAAGPGTWVYLIFFLCFGFLTSGAFALVYRFFLRRLEAQEP